MPVPLKNTPLNHVGYKAEKSYIVRNICIDK